MEGSGCREFSQSFFRFPCGLSFQSKFQIQGGTDLNGRFLSPLHGLLPQLPPVNNSSIPYRTQTNNAKPSFSIDSLLGLKDGSRVGGSGHQYHNGHPPMDWKHHQLSYQTHIQRPDSSKSKPPLRYTPYKRERKVSQLREPSETKESGIRSGKAKRVRTIFTPEQLEKLESEFERQQYMVGTERSYLAESLDLTEAQVKVWFQNRRIKWRKVHLEMQQERLRALRSQEDQEEGFDESSGSSEVVPFRSTEDFPPPNPPAIPTSNPTPKVDEGSYDVKSDWDPQSFDVDAYLLKTLGSLRPVSRWICPSHVTSDSETESE